MRQSRLGNPLATRARTRVLCCISVNGGSVKYFCHLIFFCCLPTYLFCHYPVQALSSHCKALHLVGPVWMSRESDREYKPTTQQLRAITAGKINRPVRPRRKPVQYNNLVDITESDGEVDLQGSEGAVNSSPERVPRSTQVLRASSVESLWGSSDRSGSLSCWSPETFNHKTATLVHSVEEVKTQFS